MTFDEQLRSAFETLTDRLRDDITRQLGTIADELSVAAESDRQRVGAEAAATARAAADSDADMRVANVAAAAEARMMSAVAAAEGSSREQTERHMRDAAEARIASAVAAEKASSREQTERRVRDAVEAAVAAARAELPAVDPAAGERLAGAIRAIDGAPSLTATLDMLVSGAAGEAARVALLLLRGGDLRGWQFVGFGLGFSSAGDIVVPMAGAGVVRDAIRTGSVAVGEGPDAAPSFATGVDGGRCLAAPIVIGGQPVAVLYADQGRPGAEPSAMPNWADAIDVLTRHATRCLEAIVAFQAARLFTGRTEEETAAPPGFTTDEDDAARRYARLLVSEIKLYHEAEVVAGRRERDLVTRIGAEIDRARVLYEQRVRLDLRRQTNYFHAELVRTLADGDASLLDVR
jgi:hypothetical protein